MIFRFIDYKMANIEEIDIECKLLGRRLICLFHFLNSFAIISQCGYDEMFTFQIFTFRMFTIFVFLFCLLKNASLLCLNAEFHFKKSFMNICPFTLEEHLKSQRKVMNRIISKNEIALLSYHYHNKGIVIH